MEKEVNKRVVPNSIFFSEVRRGLESGKSVVFPVKGYSMLPFIRDRVDSVELIKCDAVEVGDIVLGEWREGCYVLHRVIKIDDDTVTLMGDGNVKGVEVLKKGDVVGRVNKIIKQGGNEVLCSSKSFIRRSRIWLFLSPIRRYILAIYRRLFI